MGARGRPPAGGAVRTTAGPGRNDLEICCEPAFGLRYALIAGSRGASAQENTVPLPAMGVSQRFKNRFRKFLQRPGTTVDLAPFEKRLPAIEARADALSELDDEELTAAAGDATDETEICAVGREAAFRALEQRPYDVQLVGAMALMGGKVAEMATGEGKTLTATIAAYGHVQMGNGPVHVLTVNDYLARRDATWMEPVFTLLGLTVGWVTEASTPQERREAYGCDVTYVSVSEAGFDYLRDQLVTDVEDRVQRRLATAIVDEADSILIDEARVPLVLAGSVIGDRGPSRPHEAAELVGGLHNGQATTRSSTRGAASPSPLSTLERLEAKIESALDLDLYAEEQRRAR